MADVIQNKRGNKVSRVEKWHDTVMQWSSPQLFDRALNVAIYIASIVLMLVFVHTFIINQPVVAIGNTEHCITEIREESTARAHRRLQHRAFELMRQQCSDDVTVVTSNNVEVDGEPYPGRMAYLCRLDVQMVNPVTLKRGVHVGKCQETHANATKNKTRHFPILANVSDGVPWNFDTLPSACEFEHAMERLMCMW